MQENKKCPVSSKALRELYEELKSINLVCEHFSVSHSVAKKWLNDIGITTLILDEMRRQGQKQGRRPPEGINFTIPGVPRGKQRPKFARIGKGVRAITPEETVIYENLVKTLCPRKMLTGAIKALITAYFPIPKSTSGRQSQLMLKHKVMHTKKPDIDNVSKIILDALNGIAYHDDSQISELHVLKLYSNQPRVEVSLSQQADIATGDESNYLQPN